MRLQLITTGLTDTEWIWKGALDTFPSDRVLCPWIATRSKNTERTE